MAAIDLDVVRLLIEKGADANAEDKYKRTPLHLAAMSGHLEVVRLLTGKGADATAEDTNKRTPLLLAAKNGHLDVVGLLIEKGADVAAKDKHRRTPLLLAAENSHLEVVRLLIEEGADAMPAIVTVTNMQGHSKSKSVAAKPLLNSPNLFEVLKSPDSRSLGYQRGATLVGCLAAFFPKASQMLGFSFSRLPRVARTEFRSGVER